MSELWSVVTLGLILRILALLLGLWIDSYPGSLRYTDIDYDVFSGAGAYLYQGSSPYDQGTFRYSPLLALLMVPNEAIWAGSGKVLFCLADVMMIPAIYGLIETPPLENNHNGYGQLCSLLWAVNPLSIVICSRGNCDSLTNCLLLWTLYSIKLVRTTNNGLLRAGLALGLLVHFRLYPVIYFPAFFFHLTDRQNYDRKQLVTFFTGAAVSFTYFTAISAMCDERFLQEGLLYHLHRRDHRHNFSAYFYSLYLTASADSRACNIDTFPLPWWVSSLSLAPFLLQFTLIVVIASRMARQHLYLALLLSTMIFVAYNKVVTAQYFTWYACLVPLILPHLWYKSLSHRHVYAIAASVVAWLVCAVVWLWRAYQLEIRAVNTFLSVHHAGLAFHISHVALIASLFLAGAR